MLHHVPDVIISLALVMDCHAADDQPCSQLYKRLCLFIL